MQRKLPSCDTFVALPPATRDGYIIFGKNSDRLSDEVQEVIYLPQKQHSSGSKVQCTYIEVDQVPRTNAVVLSKPSWMWGAEMGANEHQLCIGNEAVWTKLNGPEDSVEKLLGMDMLRLALERCRTSQEAVTCIRTLLEQYGQGGDCSEGDDMTYHNSFLLCDPTEAWVLETAGSYWAAEKVMGGFRNISNQLTIGTKIDSMTPNLQEIAQEKGLWKPSDGDFHFARAFSSSWEEPEAEEGQGPSGRQQWGCHLLKEYSKDGDFSVEKMFAILRDRGSGICMSDGSFVSTGSQVSVLPPPGSGVKAVHWFTATPDPCRSMFKPFLFTPGVLLGDLTKSPTFPADKDPAKHKPRFQSKVDRRHQLWRMHERAQMQSGSSPPDEGASASGGKQNSVVVALRELEQRCIQDVAELTGSDHLLDQAGRIYDHLVKLEMNFYK